MGKAKPDKNGYKLLKKFFEASGILTELSARKFLRKDYLNAAVALISGWAQCRYVGIRLIDEEGTFPYEAYTGFSKKFVRNEAFSLLCARESVYSRIAAGSPNDRDSLNLTSGGSFYCPDASSLSKRDYSVQGFLSQAIIPLKYAGKALGVVHLAGNRQDEISLPSVEFIERISPFISQSLHKFAVVDKLRLNYEIQNAVAYILRRALEEQNIDNFFVQVLRMVVSMPWLGRRVKGAVFLLEEKPEKIVLKASVGFPRGRNREPNRILAEKFACAQTLLKEKLHPEAFLRKKCPVPARGISLRKWCYCVPINLEGKIAGIISLSADKEYMREKRKEEFLLAVADTLAGVIKRRRTEEELFSLNNDFEKAKRLADIGELAAMVAHELRNPLGVIRLAVYNIKNKFPDVSVQKNMENIEKKVQEANQIIDNLLFYSRVKKANFEKIAVCRVLDECIEAAKNRFKEKDVLVKKDYNRVKGTIIEADSLQISELFSNILNNSWEALDQRQGRIKIFVRCGKGNKMMELIVKDNGRGIEEENLQKITEPFFTTKPRGTGLGLTICLRVVKLHNGTMKIVSKKGKGTKVVIELPVFQKTTSF